MDFSKKKCIPCEGFTKPLLIDEEDKYITSITGWKINRATEHRLEKEYSLLHFKDAISFVNQIADLAEDEGHHPNIYINYNIVKIDLYTHAIGGLSENDFILAHKIDEIFASDFLI